MNSLKLTTKLQHNIELQIREHDVDLNASKKQEKIGNENETTQSITRSNMDSNQKRLDKIITVRKEFRSGSRHCHSGSRIVFLKSHPLSPYTTIQGFHLLLFFLGAVGVVSQVFIVIQRQNPIGHVVGMKFDSTIDVTNFHRDLESFGRCQISLQQRLLPRGGVCCSSAFAPLESVYLYPQFQTSKRFSRVFKCSLLFEDLKGSGSRMA